MRQPLDARRVRDLLRALGAGVRGPGKVYLTGGTSAVLGRSTSSTTTSTRRRSVPRFFKSHPIAPPPPSP